MGWTQNSEGFSYVPDYPQGEQILVSSGDTDIYHTMAPSQAQIDAYNLEIERARYAEQQAEAARQQEEAARLEKLKPLMAELGGDSPQARAIAEGLFKQGVTTSKDIEVRKVPTYETEQVVKLADSDGGYVYRGVNTGIDYSANDPYLKPDLSVGEGLGSYFTRTTQVGTANEYFNKATGAQINPNMIGIIPNGQAGVKDGDIFFHLRSDDQGQISFEPQWSPRSHGFLRDNPVGRLIMKAGAILPTPAQPFFVAANAADALAHGKYAKALLAAVPYAAQELGVTDAIKGSLGLGGPSGLDMGEVIPQGGIAQYLPSGIDVGEVIPQGGIAQYLPSGIDVGDVIPQGGIAEFVPDQIEQLLDNRLNYPDASFDNPMSAPFAPVGNAATGAVDYIPLDAIKSKDLLTNNTSGVVDGSPLDVSLADQTFQKIINPLDVDVPIDSMTARSMADSFYNPNGTLSNVADDAVTIEDIISRSDDALGNIADNPVTIEDIISRSNVADNLDELATTSPYPNADPNNPNSVLDPSKDFMGRDINDFQRSTDLMGRQITGDLTVDKVLDLGKAYLDNPVALAGLVGTGIAATGIVNNVIGGDKVADTSQGKTAAPLTSSQIPGMVQIGTTTGLEDLFDYKNLYKNSPFAQYTTMPISNEITPSFTVSDVFQNLMADANPQTKIEPNLVGLAGLQKKMMVGK